MYMGGLKIIFEDPKFENQKFIKMLVRLAPNFIKT